MSSDPHPPGNCIQTAVSKHPSEGPSLQKGPEKTQGSSWARCQPTETTPFLCVLFFSFFFPRVQKARQRRKVCSLSKENRATAAGGDGGQIKPSSPTPPTGDVLWAHTALEQFAAGCGGAAGLGSAAELPPPMGPHSLPPHKAGKSHQESPQKIQDPLTSNARDGRGTSAFLRCSPPPPPPLPHRRPPAPLQKH